MWLLPQPRSSMGKDRHAHFIFMCCPVRWLWMPSWCQPCQAARAGVALVAPRAGSVWRKSWALGVENEFSFCQERAVPGRCWTAEAAGGWDRALTIATALAQPPQPGPVSAGTDWECKRLHIIPIYLLFPASYPECPASAADGQRGGKWNWNRAAVEHHRFIVSKEQTIFLSICLPPPASVGNRVKESSHLNDVLWHITLTAWGLLCTALQTSQTRGSC